MLYNVTEIAENLNISRVTAYAKLKLKEVKPFIIRQNGKTQVDEEGLMAIKNSLDYNESAITNKEVAASTIEMDVLKVGIIDTLKSNIEFLKKQINVKDEQLSIKDNQIQKNNQLFENTQVLFKNEQEKNTSILTLPKTIHDHDIELVNNLTAAMQRQKDLFLKEQQNHKKGLFNSIFKSKK